RIAVGHDVGRDVSTNLGAAAHEGEGANPSELNQTADPAHRRIFADLGMPSYRDLAHDDRAVTDAGVVTDVARRHEKAACPHLGEAIRPSRTMDGDVLPNDGPRSHANARDRRALELDVLRVGPEDGAGTDAHARTELDAAL